MKLVMVRRGVGRYAWNVSGKTLSRPYRIEPGVPFEVADADKRWFATKGNLGGRQFELVKEAAPPVTPAAAPDKAKSAPAGGAKESKPDGKAQPAAGDK